MPQHLQHVSTWPQPAKVALPSGTIDLSRLSFRDRLEPRTHLRISGPGLTFEHHENVNANVSNLVLDCVSVDETDHGRLWTVFQARLYGIGNGDGDDVEKREKSDSAMRIYNHTTNIDVDVDMMSRTFAHADQTYRTITNHIDKRASNISAISSDLGNVPASSVVLKVFLTQSTPSTPNSKDRYEFRAEDAAINEADLYQGPLAPLQGKVVPRCYGVFRAVLGGRRTCWVMVLEMLDELTVPWGMLDNGAR